jgi:hypothetical protein
MHNTCGGVLVDMAVDWDTPLPQHIFKQAHAHLDRADLVICLGSSLRIRPAGNMPLRTLKPKKVRGGQVGKVVIVNLQATHLDKQCSLKVNHYCDSVMQSLCGRLGVQLDDSSDSSHPLTPLTGMCGYSILQGSRAEQMLRRASEPACDQEEESSTSERPISLPSLPAAKPSRKRVGASELGAVLNGERARDTNGHKRKRAAGGGTETQNGPIQGEETYW